MRDKRALSVLQGPQSRGGALGVGVAGGAGGVGVAWGGGVGGGT